MIKTALKTQRAYQKKHKKKIALRLRGYYEDNKEKILAVTKSYRKTEAGKAKIKKNREANSKKYKTVARTYRRSDHGKEVRRKSEEKRQRNLGFIPINTSFEGAEGHHMTREVVIYIPKALHRRVHHILHSGKNMQQINALSLSFLLEGF